MALLGWDTMNLKKKNGVAFNILFFKGLWGILLNGKDKCRICSRKRGEIRIHSYISRRKHWKNIGISKMVHPGRWNEEVGWVETGLGGRIFNINHFLFSFFGACGCILYYKKET
jgi:hypothetical protein